MMKRYEETQYGLRYSLAYRVAGIKTSLAILLDPVSNANFE